MTTQAALTAAQLRADLDSCPAGASGWKRFEEVALDALSYLFVPPLRPPTPQAHTYSNVERRDAVFPNRHLDPSSNWGIFRQDLEARMIAVEFKNYDKTGIGREEVDQTANHLRRAWGRLALLCTNVEPSKSAHIRRNSIFSDDEKVILFITKADLGEMLDMKDRGEDPSDLIMDIYEAFLIQHE
ncbi:hypothetical protein ACFVYR_14705 [Streptomyces sp. NPDC058284]|uniref:hypothetical protein n=1 Tax=unclassified Streptomyces TaxID=2593676 RepID=UPI0036466C7E